jgi:CDP-diacylglycerol--glycerol-3-phosphate 3-phosphatidyltransferase
MLSERLRNWAEGIRAPIGRTLGRLGASPNALTVLGYLLNVLVMYVLSTGRLQFGGILVALAGLFDALDGAVARATGQTSIFGAFLDSVTDRFSEGTVFLGLFLWYLRNGAGQELALIYIAVFGSVMVSYTRARAEGLGVECKTGLLTRFERVAVLAIGLLIQQVRLALWVIAILANVTALQRVYHVWRVTGGQDGGPGHKDGEV